MLALLLQLLPGFTRPALGAPGLCVGPVCADEISRSAKHHWQLRLRLGDQRGQHERLVVDCRNGVLSPLAGPVERGYAAAVARRACRLAGESAA
ncbi:MAG: hypothetical protein R6W06_08135 [Prochlorococcaceae cyanobacterium]